MACRTTVRMIIRRTVFGLASILFVSVVCNWFYFTIAYKPLANRLIDSSRKELPRRYRSGTYGLQNVTAHELLVSTNAMQQNTIETKPPPLHESLYDPLGMYLDLMRVIRMGDERTVVDYDFFPTDGLQPFEIVEFSSMYGPQHLFRDGQTTSVCPVFCKFRNAHKNATKTAEADVVVFTALEQVPFSHKPKAQMWVGHYFESPEHYPLLQNAEHMSRFNFMMGFMPLDDIFQGGMIFDTLKHLNTTRKFAFPSFEERLRQSMMSVWISNCNKDKTGRKDFLKQLQAQGVSISSYGACDRTQPPVVQSNSSQWAEFSRIGAGELLMAVSIEHLFFYAAENGNCGYYHTEKVFHALVAGTVPVYVGNCETIKRFVPENSVILANDFEDATKLAAYLLYLSTNETAYSAHLLWRHDWGVTSESQSSTLATIMRLSSWAVENDGEHMRCALCQFFRKRPVRKSAKPLNCLT